MVKNLTTDQNHPPGWLTPTEAAYLRNTASQATMLNVLEIGTLYGRSSSFILEGLKARFTNKLYRLWCVEPWISWSDELISKYGLPAIVFWQYMIDNGYKEHVRLLNGTSMEMTGAVLPRQYDFAFVDGSHLAAPVMHDILLCSKVTHTILLHDYAEHKDFQVIEPVNWWVNHSQWRIVEVVGAIVKIVGPQLTLATEQNDVRWEKV